MPTKRETYIASVRRLTEAIEAIEKAGLDEEFPTVYAICQAAEGYMDAVWNYFGRLREEEKHTLEECSISTVETKQDANVCLTAGMKVLP